MNEATRANLQANKRILLEWDVLTVQFLYPIILQCHLLIHWCTDCFLFWGSGNGHNLCVPWGYSRKTYTKNEEIIILKSWIKDMVIPENVRQIHRADTHFLCWCSGCLPFNLSHFGEGMINDWQCQNTCNSRINEEIIKLIKSIIYLHVIYI